MQYISINLVFVVIVLSIWCNCAMAATYNEELNSTRNGLCSKGHDLVDKCFVKRYKCKLTPEQEHAGTILYKICQDKKFQKDYQSFMDCLSNSYQLMTATICHFTSKLTDWLATENNCTRSLGRLQTFINCGQGVCSNWSSVAETVKDGVNSTCSVDLSTFSYDKSGQSSVRHFDSTVNIIITIVFGLIGRLII